MTSTMTGIVTTTNTPSEREARRLFLRRRRTRRRILAAVALLVLAPVLYSYVTTVMRPSSVPLGVRSVEWVRLHHGAWIVNTAERVYYGWKTPKPGGPPLRTIPSVGVAAASGSRQSKPRVAAVARAQSRYVPPRVRSAILPPLAGEGVWQRTGPLVNGAPPLLVTTVRPEAVYPRNLAYLAWVDHTRTQLGLYPGRYEPPASVWRGPMQIPYGQRWRVLAAFNSGFTHRDGRGGFFVSGMSYQPLQQGQGTLVAYRDGTLDIVSWQGGAVPGRSVVLARQNLPLIVSGGRPNPSLNDGPQWGATLGNKIRVWRSGVGVDRRGNLVYAAANYMTVSSLASVLIRAGAVRAIELDINPQWPSFITYARSGARDPLKLVPNGMQPLSRYLSPDDRDFFTIYRRVAGQPAQVPFR